MLATCFSKPNLFQNSSVMEFDLQVYAIWKLAEYCPHLFSRACSLILRKSVCAPSQTSSLQPETQLLPDRRQSEVPRLAPRSLSLPFASLHFQSPALHSPLTSYWPVTYVHTAVPLTSILARRSIYLITDQSFQCTLLFARCPNPNVTFGSFVF